MSRYARLTICGLLLLRIAQAGAAFSDVSGHRFAPAITYVQSQDIVQGYSDGTFRPDALINRVEFLKILLEADDTERICTDQLFTYTDTDPNAWYDRYVQDASNCSIVQGYPDGSFRPGHNINFAEAAKIVTLTFDLPIPKDSPTTPWYQPYLDALQAANAWPRSDITPGHSLTRGEMAQIIYRLIGDSQSNEPFTNHHSADRMLLVFSAPSINSEYYADDFDNIVAFQKGYAQAVMGHDNVMIIVDEQTRPYYSDDLPADILLTATVDDIWVRDFSTVLPERMHQFTYDPSYFESREDAEYIQESLNSLAETLGLDYDWSNEALDGGNIVDNGLDKLVTTERFLEDNELTKAEAKQLLKETLGVSEVAIIPYDDEVMGHSDGMVMWTDEYTLLINEYDEPFRTEVFTELQASFTDVQIIEVPASISYDSWREFNSACGVNLNSVVTYQHIYTPTFGNPAADEAALEVIRANTDKDVHTIPAQNVCHMGGSVRCLSWQLTGENARKLIEAARK